MLYNGGPEYSDSSRSSSHRVPLTVIEELDGLKTRIDDVGRAARNALRTIEDLRVRAGGSLATAVPVSSAVDAATLQIEINGIQHHLLESYGLDPGVPDNRIIGAALGQRHHGPTTIVSNDAALRIKAAHLGLRADAHRPAGGATTRLDPGWTTLEVDASRIDALSSSGRIAADQLASDPHPSDPLAAGAITEQNGFGVLGAGSQSALVRRAGSDVVLVPHQSPEPWGLRARSKEQRFALELLLDPDVSVVALDGPAGTGKTLLAIAAGLEHVVERRSFERLAIYRPLVAVGRAEVGFLPGGLDDKLDPWMSAIHDAIVALTDIANRGGRRGPEPRAHDAQDDPHADR